MKKWENWENDNNDEQNNNSNHAKRPKPINLKMQIPKHRKLINLRNMKNNIHFRLSPLYVPNIFHPYVFIILSIVWLTIKLNACKRVDDSDGE